MQSILPCGLMASFHHHFCFAWLKPLTFIWHHLNVMKRSRKAENGHMFFAGKSPGVCTPESKPKSCSQEQAGNIQQYMRHITSMCCRHLFHCMEKPRQQILLHAAPRAMATSHGALLGQDFTELGQEICYVTATRQPP